MIETIAVGCANFLFIFLKAFQQRNVAFMHYGWVVPTSLLMGTVEVGVIGVIALKATAAASYLAMWPFVLAIGIGGGLGAVASMYIHHRYLGRKDDADIRHQVPRVPTPSGSIQSLRHSGGM